MKIELRNVKINAAMSEETTSFTATVYADGRRAGLALNHGHGGPNRYDWDDKDLGRRIEEWAKAQPTEFEFEKLDQILGKLLERQGVLNQLKRWTRRETLFRLKGDERATWRRITNQPFNPKVVAHIRTKYGEQVEHILNPADLEAGLPYC